MYLYVCVVVVLALLACGVYVFLRRDYLGGKAARVGQKVDALKQSAAEVATAAKETEGAVKDVVDAASTGLRP